MDKTSKFVSWLCRVKGARFPFLQNVKEVKPPVGFEDIKGPHDYSDMELQDIYETHDCKISPEDSCEVCTEMAARGLIENTLCDKPHNNGDDRPEVCGECMAIKHNI